MASQRESLQSLSNEVRFELNSGLNASIEHAAQRRGMTRATFIKMAITERLERFGELNVCDGVACNGVCDGEGHVQL